MWHQYILNPEALTSLFKEIPDLSHIVLHEVVLERQGEFISLRFDLDQFPLSAPDAWSEYNTVQVVLQIIQTSSLFIKGWQSPLSGILNVSLKEEETYQLTFESVGCAIDIEAAGIRLEKVSAYKNGTV